MSLYPGALLPNIDQQFCDLNGVPLSGGLLYFYLAGTTTPAPVYSDVDLTVEQTQPVVLYIDGRPANPIFIAPHGYKVVVQDSAGVPLYTIDQWEDIGQVFAQTFGNVLAEGSKEVVSGYAALATDRLITVDSTGGANPCVVNLLPADECTQPLVIKNLGTVPLAVTPNGADTIEGIAAAYTVAASTSPLFRTIELVSDGVSAYYIRGGIGV